MTEIVPFNPIVYVPTLHYLNVPILFTNFMSLTSQVIEFEGPILSISLLTFAEADFSHPFRWGEYRFLKPLQISCALA